MEINDILNNIKDFFENNSKESLDDFFYEFDQPSDEDISLEDFQEAYKNAYQILNGNIYDDRNEFETGLEKIIAPAKTIDINEMDITEYLVSEIAVPCTYTEGMNNDYIPSNNLIADIEWAKAA